MWFDKNSAFGVNPVSVGGEGERFFKFFGVVA